jgi:hypothetical protein
MKCRDDLLNIVAFEERLQPSPPPAPDVVISLL